MLADWFSSQLDYIFLCYGFAFIFLAIVSFRLSSFNLDCRLPFKWLALFGLLHGLNEWSELFSLSFDPMPQLYLMRSLLLAVSFRILLEFGMRSLRAQTGHEFSQWQVTVLTCLGILGAFRGIEGLNAGFRYFLGFPAVLLTAYVFYLESSRFHLNARKSLELAAILTFLYGLLACLVVTEAPFWPANVVNSKAWFGFFGFPVEALRGMVAIGISLAIFWFGRAIHDVPVAANSFKFFLVPSLAIFFIASGWIITDWRGSIADKGLRKKILRLSSNIAGTINYEDAEKLKFASSDVFDENFLLLQAQLKAFARRNQGVRGIYTVALKNSRPLFGPESYSEDDSDASPPGTVYEKPHPEILEVFGSGVATVIGPFTDEYGTFVSSFAPVKNPKTGATIMIIGVDVLAVDFQKKILRERALVIIFVMVLLLSILAGWLLILCRLTLDLYSQNWLVKHAETCFVLTVGLTSTLALALLINDMENRKVLNEFQWIADTRYQIIRDSFRQTGRDIQGLARIFSAKGGPDDYSDFTAFAAPLTGATQALEWVPVVAESELSSFEQRIRQDGFAHFKVFAIDETGEAVKVSNRSNYFPVTYIVPWQGNQPAFGYDLGSELRRGSAIRYSLQSRSPATVLPLKLVQNSDSWSGMLILEPVIDRSNNSVRGFIVCVMNLEKALKRFAISAGLSRDVVVAELSMIEEQPTLLASTAGEKAASHAQSGISAEFPLFVFGRSLSVKIYPTESYLAAGGVPRNTLLTILAGLIVTFLSSGFVLFLRNRQHGLELMVDIRARELVERENDLYITLNSIGDAVMATDTELKITRMNPAAVNLTGWSFAEAFGIHISRVFRIIDKNTRQSVECPVASAIRSGQIVELAADVTLISRSGEEWHISDSAAPILDADGVIRGGVLVFHDITEQSRVRNELRESEEKLKTLITSIPGIAYRCKNDFDWTMVFINDEIERLTGFAAQNFMGNRVMSFASIIHPDDTHIIAEKVNAGTAQKGFFELEYRLKKFDGDYIWVFERGRGIFDGYGKLQYLEGVIIDINARKEAERALSDSEIRTKAIAESAIDAILILDQNGRITYWNPAATVIFGYDNGEALGKSFFELLGLKDAENDGQKILREGHSAAEGFFPKKYMELKALTKSGKEIEIALSISEFEIGDERLKVMICRDETDVRIAQRKLAESREQYMLAISGTKDGIWDWNLNDNSLFLSPNWKKMLDHEDHEIANHYSSFECRIHPDDKEFVLDYVRNYLKGKIDEYKMEFRFRKRGGEYIWVMARGEALRDENGVPYRMAGTHTDISQRKNSEAALKKTLAELEKANRELKVLNDRAGELAVAANHAVKSAGPEIIIDPDDLRQRLLGDKKLVSRILHTFLRDFPGQLRDLKNACERQELEDCVRITHNIKGSAANISACVLENAAYALEAKLKQRENIELQSEIDELENRFNQLSAELTRLNLI